MVSSGLGLNDGRPLGNSFPSVPRCGAAAPLLPARSTGDVEGFGRRDLI